MMKHKYLKLTLGSLILIGLLFSCKTMEKTTTMTKENTVKAPVAAKKYYEHKIHKDVRVDNYFWLKERENPEVIKYLEDENTYTDMMMKDTEELQETLYDEMVGRVKKDDSSVPYFLNGYLYYTRFEEGGEYPIYCRKKGDDSSPEEIMLNVNKMAEGFDYYMVRGLEVSPDNAFVAFGVDTVSRRKYTIYIKNLESGEILKDAISNTTGSVAWANDNKTIFFDRKDETLRPFQIYKYELGKKNSETLVFEEPEETFSTGVYKSKSNDYIIIASGSTLSTEYQVLNADNPNGDFKIIQPRQRDLEYSIVHFKDYFYILTNWDAKNFRLMKTPIDKTEKENWVEVIPQRADVLLEDIDVFDTFYVLAEREKGLNQLRIIHWDGSEDYYLPFDEPAYMAYISYNPEINTSVFRYRYTSLTTPRTTYDYNVETKKSTLMKRDEVVGGYDPTDYETERIYVEARDGKQIPLSIVYKKGLEKNGQNPLILYGYGSYGITIDPSFRSYRISMLDRGFIWAIAHIRGSQMLGREWYEAGKLFNKKNTFTDFIDCGNYLADEGYTNHNKLFGYGGSAGGLLIGAVVNMAPEVFRGVVAAVPFVDVVTTMLDDSIPLTTGEYDEWGNPNVKEYYEYMLSYSPYDNVEKKDYPAILVTTGLHDSQVQYWEPAKWVTRLRDRKTNDNLLLLKTDMKTGHGGASGRFQFYKEIAFDMAFFMKLADQYK